MKYVLTRLFNSVNVHTAEQAVAGEIPKSASMHTTCDF